MTSRCTITIPGTTLVTSRFGYGTASIHHRKSESERQAILAVAWECGITYFDTAPYYAHRLAERSLGKFLAGRRSSALVATKLGILPSKWLAAGAAALYAGKAAKSILSRFGARVPRVRRIDFGAKDAVAVAEECLAGSMRALRVDMVDVLHLHEPPGDAAFSDEALRWMESLPSRGIARYLGLAGDAENVVEVAKRYPSLACVLQVRDSIEGREADLIDSIGREKQITFGYFRAGAPTAHAIASRNPSGLILSGSTNPSRIRALDLA